MTEPTFEVLDLTVLLGPDDDLWVSAASPAAAVHGVRRRGGKVPPFAELLELTEDFLDGVGRAMPQPCLDIGTTLREILFAEPEIAGLFHQTRGVAADKGRPMLVRLLAVPGELAAIPWELTLDPDEDRFLTLAPNTHLVRSPRSRTYPVRPSLIAPPLNLLIVLSSPVLSGDGEEAAFDLFEEKRNLLAELVPLEESGLLNIDIEEHATIDNLRRRIAGRRDGYHLVHYLGHAVPNALVLEDRFRRAVRATAESVNELLRICPNLRMVMLAGCDTARAPELTIADRAAGSADWRLRLSTADRCARDSCPVVIGMQAVLPFRTEWLFTRSFYRAVAAGYSIADAVRLGRDTVRSDEFVGGKKADWAIPTMIVAGDAPGPLVDPTAPARPYRRPHPTELKLDIVERDREFFSRLIPLRLCVDVLTGATNDRVLIVTGPSGVGKSRLVDRVLEDVDDRVDFVLYTQAHRLNVADPVLELCQWVAELLSQRDGRLRVRSESWKTSADWWDRLVQELPNRRFVIVIDDIDQLRPSAALSKALKTLADRRSLSRFALIGRDLPDWILAQSVHERMAWVRLAPFTWDEMWRWIRRNLPVLTRIGRAGLAAHYPRLGCNLELWSRLADEVASSSPDIDFAELVDLIAPRPLHQDASPSAGEAQPVNGPRGTAKRGHRPLRVAVAGPLFPDRDEFAVSLTRWAAEYDVGGRALVPGDDSSSTLAVLLPVSSPFDGASRTSLESIVAWIDDVRAQDPDIVVLDFGAEDDYPLLRTAVMSLAECSLVIAAAGNTPDRVYYPGRYRQVLTVGALANATTLDPDCGCEPRRRKPDLFTMRTASGTPFSVWPSSPGDDPGTGFAALRVAVTASLVWATYPEKDPGWVRQVLIDTSSELTIPRRKWRPRALEILPALDRAREELVVDTLRGKGRMTLLELLAGVGLPGWHTDATLQRLLGTTPPRVSRTITESTESYQLVPT